MPVSEAPIQETCNITQTFDELKVCVIIPSYNNAASISSVVQDVLKYTANIIIVNDGSTDATKDIVGDFRNLVFISYEKNRGKGYALRCGFKKAIELGYLHAITIDSDGQHFAKDLPSFIDKLLVEGETLIMGARNMKTTENVPGKSSFGNKFSNFWYKVETGIALPDTQTGYRLYPLRPSSKIKFFTRKYEFEIEAIVRLAWKGVKVVSVPITVYYPPENERVSHFRPFRDFVRISILNTVLVVVCLFYIWPRNFFRRFTKKNWKKELKSLLLRPDETAVTKANSAAFGGFMGIFPIWGLQLLIGIPLAHFFKLNKAIFILAAHISIPPMIPLIVFLSHKMGKPFMASKATNLDFSNKISLTDIGKNLEQYIYGSIFLAIIVGIVFWLVTFALVTVSKKKASTNSKKS